jgi:cytidine deaminase
VGKGCAERSTPGRYRAGKDTYAQSRAKKDWEETRKTPYLYPFILSKQESQMAQATQINTTELSQLHAQVLEAIKQITQSEKAADDLISRLISELQAGLKPSSSPAPVTPAAALPAQAAAASAAAGAAFQARRPSQQAGFTGDRAVGACNFDPAKIGSDARSLFFISSQRAHALTQSFNITTEELLSRLVLMAKPFARPPISKYHVGAAGLGKSGAIYLGVNLEFQDAPLNQTVHAEQFLITNARNHGETELTAVALSAAPCGHCRQFFNEIGNDVTFLTPGATPKTLSTLLPESFGPKDLGVKGGLLTPVDGTPAQNRKSLEEKALEAASRSYAPYSKSPAGVAIQVKNGKIYTGSYLENAAFNPSLSPLQAALIALVADGEYYVSIEKVLLMENPTAPVSHERTSQDLLKGIAPHATFTTEPLPRQKL